MDLLSSASSVGALPRGTDARARHRSR